MSNNYTQMIANDMLCHKEEVRDVCVCITTVDIEYFMSFIEYETDDALGIRYVTIDNTERFIILNKQYIINVSIIYEQDIDILYKHEEEEIIDMMYQ